MKTALPSVQRFSPWPNRIPSQETESLSRYGCFAYRSSQLFLFSQCNEFRFNALSLLPPSPIDSRVRPDGILRNEWARRRHERRRVIEPLKLSFADPNFVAVGINADTIDDVPGNFSSLSLPSFYRGEEEIRLGPEVGEDRWMHEVEDVWWSTLLRRRRISEKAINHDVHDVYILICGY